MTMERSQVDLGDPLQGASRLFCPTDTVGPDVGQRSWGLAGTNERAEALQSADPRYPAAGVDATTDAVASSGPSAVAEGIETEKLHVEGPGFARAWKEMGGKSKG